MAPIGITLGDEGGTFKLPGAQTLVVCLHAYTVTPRSLQRVAEVVREEFPDSDIHVPKLPFSLFSWADPEKVAAGVVNDISRLWRDGRYKQIVLVGHSMGAVLARKVWALAHGATPAATVDAARAEGWASSIDRIVLLAATNRGWVVSSAMDPFQRLAWRIGSGWANFCRHALGREPNIARFRRGASFLTTVRLQCLAVSAALGDKAPLTVQLIGTIDDLIAPTDNLDLATGQDFLYLEVSGATHSGIVELDEGNGSTGASAIFRQAIKGDRQELTLRSLKPEDVFDVYDESIDDHDATSALPPSKSVEHVVFVVHGIRDRGFWTRRIARQVKQLAGSRTCRTVTSTYGYFPMGPFLVPWIRDRKVEWLLDQYVSAKALYPMAKFSYIGHSNGTYLLAKALTECPALSFSNIVFAGSVVSTKFDWTALIPRQVERVLNYVATDDVVVAVFPYWLERMKLQDLGGAGHRGFVDQAAVNFRHVSGGHGAALTHDRWQEMAKFVLEGTPPREPEPRVEQSSSVKRLEALSPLIWFGLAALILGLAVAILTRESWPVWVVAFVFVFYLSCVKAILTRA